MSDNLKLWNTLGKTDPAHTKKFTRAGGFKGTSVKPIYCDRKMTEQFGACGIGWGMTKPEFQVVTLGTEVAVYCTVGLWHGDHANLVYGVGGDFVAKNNKNGLFADDEAFKKSYTDALGNAMKHIGMAADIHMGQHDDDKYVTELRREFAEGDHTPSAAETAAINAINECTSREALLAMLNRDKDKLANLPNGGADRVRERATERLTTDFPKPATKDAA